MRSKFYLLLSLSLSSTNQLILRQEEETVTINYAGDCWDVSNFDTSFGDIVIGCGDQCAVMQEAFTAGADWTQYAYTGTFEEEEEEEEEEKYYDCSYYNDCYDDCYYYCDCDNPRDNAYFCEEEEEEEEVVEEEEEEEEEEEVIVIERIPVDGCYGDYYCEEVAGLCAGDETCVGALYCFEGDVECFIGWHCGTDDECTETGLACNRRNRNCLEQICETESCIAYLQCQEEWDCVIDILCPLRDDPELCYQEADYLYGQDLRRRRLQQRPQKKERKFRQKQEEDETEEESEEEVVESKWYPYNNILVLKGMNDNKNSLNTQCDHYHMYSFTLDSVSYNTQADSRDNLVITAYNMVGAEESCYYNWVSLPHNVLELSEMPSNQDQFTFTCGWYTVYEWSGAGQVMIQVNTNLAFSIAILWSLLISYLAF